MYIFTNQPISDFKQRKYQGFESGSVFTELLDLDPKFEYGSGSRCEKKSSRRLETLTSFLFPCEDKTDCIQQLLITKNFTKVIRSKFKK